MLKKISFLAHLEELPAMLRWIEERLLEVPFPPPEMRKAIIAMEEAIVNVIHHAYGDQNGFVDLWCQIFPNNKIQFIVQDQGHPFDPLQQNSSPHEEKEGGLGIILMKEYMDEIYYKRSHSYNCLTLVKKITSFSRLKK